MIVGPSVVDGELRLDRFETNGTVEEAAATNQGKCPSAKFNDQVWLSLVGGDL
jgi:hypothetical protein